MSDLSGHKYWYTFASGCEPDSCEDPDKRRPLFICNEDLELSDWCFVSAVTQKIGRKWYGKQRASEDYDNPNPDHFYVAVLLYYEKHDPEPFVEAEIQLEKFVPVFECTAWNRAEPDPP